MLDPQPTALPKPRDLSGERLSVFGLTQPAVLPAAAGLMKKYSDLPMDFADATLTLLAEQADILEILTLDRRGFTVYRTRERKPFHLVLDAT